VNIHNNWSILLDRRTRRGHILEYLDALLILPSGPLPFHADRELLELFA
jgi:hypothetical protein